MNKEMIETARKVADLLDKSGVSYSAPFTIRMLCDEMERIESTRDWTPCAEGLPRSETDNVLVCFLDKYGFMEVAIGWYWIPSGKWYTDEKQNSVDVLAWQPLPEPYNPDRKEDANSDDVSQWPEWKQRAALSNYKFENSDHIVDANKKVDQVCPVCNSMAHHDPHFGRVVCRQCGWMQEDAK